MASNTFIHKHYEKVILAGLLLICCGLLYLQLSVVQKSQGKKVDDIVNAPEPPADFEPNNYKDDKYSTPALYDANGLKWGELWDGKNPFAGDKNAEHVDMMVPVKMALCKNTSSDLGAHLIPIDYFPPIGSKETKKCEYCKVTLDAPKKADADIVEQKKEVVDDDTNKNGIPDEWENEHGIFAAPTGDGQEAVIGDADSDGFDNKEEYLAKTHPCDPKSHPLFVTKLVLDDSKKIEDVSFDSFIKSNIAIRNFKLDEVSSNNNKAKRRIKFSYYAAGKKAATRTPLFTLGDEILYARKTSGQAKPPTIGFKIEDVGIDMLEKKGKNGAVEKIKRNFVIIVSTTDPSIRFKCYENERIITGHKRVFFKSVAEGKDYEVLVGDKITLGSEEAGFEIYTVASLNEKDNVVTLKDAKGKEYLIKLPVTDVAENEEVKEETAE